MQGVHSALKDMGSYKAIGPDGFHVLFFKKTWSFTGQALLSFLQKVMTEQVIPKEEAKDLLVLIPKEDNLSSIRSFRRISLCNIVYKLLTKLIFKRLRGVLGEIIAPN